MHEGTKALSPDLPGRNDALRFRVQGFGLALRTLRLRNLHISLLSWTIGLLFWGFTDLHEAQPFQQLLQTIKP